MGLMANLFGNLNQIVIHSIYKDKIELERRYG